MSVKVGLCLVALRPRPPFRAAARRWGQMQDMQGLPAPATVHAPHRPSPTSWCGLKPVILRLLAQPRLAVWSAAREGQNSPSGRSRSRDRPMPSSWVVAIRTSAARPSIFFFEFFFCYPSSRKTELPASDSPAHRASALSHVGGKVSRTASQGPGLLFDVACRR